MCDPVTLGIGSLIVSTIGTAGSLIQGASAAKEQKKANATARANADRTAAQAEQELNRKNAKQPNMMALFAGNRIAEQGGSSGTFLTGPKGVDPSSLTLGKTQLLGG